MKVPAINTTDIWFTRLSGAMGEDIETEMIKDVAVENRVYVESARLQFEGVDNAYKPYVVITGYLVESKPTTELPYGISEITWGSGTQNIASYRYDFSPTQLAQMVTDKGLYEPDFDIPSNLVGLEWLLPGKIDTFIVAPIDFDSPPIVFVEPFDITSSKITEISSGYDLVAFMPDKEVASTVDLSQDFIAEEQMSRAIEDDIVADVVQDVESEFVAIDKQHDNEEFASSFAELMAAAAAKREAREAALEAEAARVRSGAFDKDIVDEGDKIQKSVEQAVAAPLESDEDEKLLAEAMRIADDVDKAVESKEDEKASDFMKFDDYLLDDEREKKETELRAQAQSIIDDDNVMVIEDELVIDS